MLPKQKLRKNVNITACLLLILFFGLYILDIDISGDYTNDFIDVNLIIDALQQAEIHDIDMDNKYQLTAIIVHSKHLSQVKQSVQYYLNSKLFKEVIIWNNNPLINLVPDQVFPEDPFSNQIRIINSNKNLRDEAKYRACAEAQTLACFYVDGNWDTSHYIHSLIASFRSDPNVLHTATNEITYYKNMLWTFMDSQIDLHTGFSWVNTGSIFLREHAQQHLQLLRTNLQTNQELFVLSDMFFPIWLNDIPTQMVVNLRSFPANADDNDSPTDNLHNLQQISSVLAIRKLEHALRLNQSTEIFSFPRQQNRRFPYYVKSSSAYDDFIFYSNILPVDIENIPFDITKDADRATDRNVPTGSSYTQFSLRNTLKAVDSDEKTCWHPLEQVRKGDFFAIDFLRIQNNITFSLIIGHSQKLQKRLDMRISFDGVQWISHRLRKGITTNAVSAEGFHRVIIDSREFPPEFQTFRYIKFNSTNAFSEAFQVCDVRIRRNLKINLI